MDSTEQPTPAAPGRNLGTGVRVRLQRGAVVAATALALAAAADEPLPQAQDEPQPQAEPQPGQDEPSQPVTRQQRRAMVAHARKLKAQRHAVVRQRQFSMMGGTLVLDQDDGTQKRLRVSVRPVLVAGKQRGMVAQVQGLPEGLWGHGTGRPQALLDLERRVGNWIAQLRQAQQAAAAMQHVGSAQLERMVDTALTQEQSDAALQELERRLAADEAQAQGDDATAEPPAEHPAQPVHPCLANVLLALRGDWPQGEVEQPVPWKGLGEGLANVLGVQVQRVADTRPGTWYAITSSSAKVGPVVQVAKANNWKRLCVLLAAMAEEQLQQSAPVG